MEKQLLCDECDLAFAKTSALKEHKQVQHEGNSNFWFYKMITKVLFVPEDKGFGTVIWI